MESTELSQHIFQEATKYASANNTSLDTIRSSLAGEVKTSFNNFLQGSFLLKDIETLLTHTIALTKSNQDTNSTREAGNEESAFVQFVNHTVIPHLDFFVIQTSDMSRGSRVSQKGLNPNIAKLGRLDTHNSEIQVVDRSNNQLTEIELSFVADNRNGTINDRMSKARYMVNTWLDEYEEIKKSRQDTLNRIISDLENEVIRFTTAQHAPIDALNKNRAISHEKQNLGERKAELLNASAQLDDKLQEEFTYGAAQFLFGVFAAEPKLIAKGAETAVRGYRKVKIDHELLHKELNKVAQEYEALTGKEINIAKLYDNIDKVFDNIRHLNDERQLQQQFGNAQKLDAVRKAYLAKSMLDFGERNMRRLDQLCKKHGVSSIDACVEQQDNRTSEALSNLCFGYADSNDLSVLIARANTHAAATPAETVLKELVETQIKPNIDAYYTHAAQVDKIYQANLLGLGTPFYEARKMVARATDDAFEAVIAYQMATHPALIEGEYSAIGARDIGKIFHYWQQRYGDRTADNTGFQREGEPTSYFPKRINALPEHEQLSFVEMVKRSQTQSGLPTPQVQDNFLRLCAYEYAYPQRMNEIAHGGNPDTAGDVLLYPAINATINHFIREMHLETLDTYRQHVGERLDNLVAQTFLDFFQELGKKHITHEDIVLLKQDLVEAKARPELYALASEDYLRELTQDAQANFPLFLEIYARNLEKMLTVIPEAEQKTLNAQIEKVKTVTQGKLAPEITQPDSPAAWAKAINDNHTMENTHWRGGR